jgi:hypothetical protein
LPYDDDRRFLEARNLKLQFAGFSSCLKKQLILILEFGNCGKFQLFSNLNNLNFQPDDISGQSLKRLKVKKP